MLQRYEDAKMGLLLGKLDMPALILLITNAKLSSTPYQNYIKKLFKLCQNSIDELDRCLHICPAAHLHTFLDTLVQESNREEKYVAFRHSFLMSNHFYDNRE